MCKIYINIQSIFAQTLFAFGLIWRADSDYITPRNMYNQTIFTCIWMHRRVVNVCSDFSIFIELHSGIRALPLSSSRHGMTSHFIDTYSNSIHLMLLHVKWFCPSDLAGPGRAMPYVFDGCMCEEYILFLHLRSPSKNRHRRRQDTLAHRSLVAVNWIEYRTKVRLGKCRGCNFLMTR